MRLPGALIDFNVHPQKREVRLRYECEIKGLIVQAIQKALRQEQIAVQEISQNHLCEEPFIPPYWEAPSSPFSEKPSIKKMPWIYQTAAEPSIQTDHSEVENRLFNQIQEQTKPKILATAAARPITAMSPLLK